MVLPKKNCKIVNFLDFLKATKSLHRYFLWKPKVGETLGDLFFLDRALHWVPPA